jgi:hypothetical protein
MTRLTEHKERDAWWEKELASTAKKLEPGGFDQEGNQTEGSRILPCYRVEKARVAIPISWPQFWAIQLVPFGIVLAIVFIMEWVR